MKKVNCIYLKYVWQLFQFSRLAQAFIILLVADAEALKLRGSISSSAMDAGEPVWRFS